MYLNQSQYAKRIGKSKQYVNKLVKMGVIPLHGKKIKISEADECIKDHEDPTRDSQRDANARLRDDTLFAEENIPGKSLATMTPEEVAKRRAEIKKTLDKLSDMSDQEENSQRPKEDATGKEWTTFKIMQQALNYELDRKTKEKNLISLDDAKAAAEILVGPLNQGLDDLPFNFKSQFPDVDDEAIEWLLTRTNQLKVNVQNVVI